MDTIEKEEKATISENGVASKLKAAQSLNLSESDIIEPIVYDYMKYANKKSKGRHGHGNRHGHGQAKVKKCVSFKHVVELVTFTDDWKMQTSESSLRAEDQQRKCPNMKRNF